MPVATGRFDKWALTADLTSLSGTADFTGVNSPIFTGGKLIIDRTNGRYAAQASSVAWNSILQNFTGFVRCIPATTGANLRSLVTKFSGVANRSFLMGASNAGDLNFSVRNQADAAKTSSSGVTCVAGTQYNIFFGYDPVLLKPWIEVDGAFRATSTAFTPGDTIQESTADIRVGHSVAAGGLWDGPVWDLEFWSRTLTRAERRARVNNREVVKSQLTLVGVS